MMSIFFGAEFVGYLTPIPVIAITTAAETYATAKPVYYLVFGCLFIIFAILEVFTFHYMPSKLGIKIDQR